MRAIRFVGIISFRGLYRLIGHNSGVNFKTISDSRFQVVTSGPTQTMFCGIPFKAISCGFELLLLTFKFAFV
jgi:hypothetical protein